MSEVAELVRAAAEGDQAAWNGLVDRYNGLVWSVARSHRLALADASDVVQTTWLRLVEHLGRLQDPERVGAWLATTARRESLRALRHSARQIPTEELLERAGDVLGWIADGSLDIRIGARYPLEDARRAHEDLEARRSTGKLLLIP